MQVGTLGVMQSDSRSGFTFFLLHSVKASEVGRGSYFRWGAICDLRTRSASSAFARLASKVCSGRTRRRLKH